MALDSGPSVGAHERLRVLCAQRRLPRLQRVCNDGRQRILILAMFEAYFISSKCCLLLTFLLKRVGGFLCSQCLKRCFERKTTSSLLYTLHFVLLSTFPLTLKDFFVLHVSCCLFPTFPLKASDCSGLLTTTEGPLLPLLWLSTNIG